ncbi:MAG: hypothetical protein LUH63_15000 [Parabacteroides sp.]|nr:hypothetical protein [Parabacteroides sp.]
MLPAPHGNENGRRGEEDGRNGNDDRPHLNKPLKFLLNIWSVAGLRFATGDSQAVMLYHIVDVSVFR